MLRGAVHRRWRVIGRALCLCARVNARPAPEARRAPGAFQSFHGAPRVLSTSISQAKERLGAVLDSPTIPTLGQQISHIKNADCASAGCPGGDAAVGCGGPPAAEPLLVVFGLDETLVFTHENPTAPYDTAICDGAAGGTAPAWFIKFRPGVREFLDWCVAQEFELGVYTTGSERYLAAVLQHLDPARRYFPSSRRLARSDCAKVTRQFCVGAHQVQHASYLKFLSKFRADLRRVVLVEDSILALVPNPENGIIVPAFRGGGEAGEGADAGEAAAAETPKAENGAEQKTAAAGRAARSAGTEATVGDGDAAVPDACPAPEGPADETDSNDGSGPALTGDFGGPPAKPASDGGSSTSNGLEAKMGAAEEFDGAKVRAAEADAVRGNGEGMDAREGLEDSAAAAAPGAEQEIDVVSRDRAGDRPGEHASERTSELDPALGALMADLEELRAAPDVRPALRAKFRIAEAIFKCCMPPPPPPA